MNQETQAVLTIRKEGVFDYTFLRDACEPKQVYNVVGVVINFMKPKIVML